MWCVCVCVCRCMCVCSLSLFLFLLRSDGSNVFYFFNTWPCLFGRTYQRRLVGTSSICLPTYLSGLVWSNACRQPCAFLSFSFLILSFSHDWHGWTLPPSTFSMYLSLSVPPLHHHHHPPSPHFSNLTFWRAP